jgi:heme exporter protein D
MGSHVAFIFASYAFTALIVGGLILRAVIDHRIQQQALAELESRGIGRRSGRPASPLPGGERSARSAG